MAAEASMSGQNIERSYLRLEEYMNKIEIRLNTKNDAIDFVAKVTNYPDHIDLKYGHCVVDAKLCLVF